MSKYIKLFMIGLCIASLGCKKNYIMPDTGTVKLNKVYSNYEDLIQAASPQLYNNIFSQRNMRAPVKKIEIWNGFFNINCAFGASGSDFNESNCCMAINSLCGIIVYGGGSPIVFATGTGTQQYNDIAIANAIITPGDIRNYGQTRASRYQINNIGAPPMFAGNASNVNTDSLGFMHTTDFVIDTNAQKLH